MFSDKTGSTHVLVLLRVHSEQCMSSALPVAKVCLFSGTTCFLLCFIIHRESYLTCVAGYIFIIYRPMYLTCIGG